MVRDISKTNVNVKKLYGIYLENESENVIELIKEENRIKELKKQLAAAKENEQRSDFERLDKIKQVSDVCDDLMNRDKNKVLKECIEKIVITNDNLDIYFVTF